MSENTKSGYRLCPDGKFIILSAPSGAGKTTIMRKLVERFPVLEFSVSATCRDPREGEIHGRDYHFVTPGEFERMIGDDHFVEWEEVYAGIRYGTLKSELIRITEAGKAVIFDVDVMGGMRLKTIFGNNALSLFIMPPSVDELRRRIERRGTETPESLERRVGKAEKEMGYSGQFDVTVINDRLEDAVEKVCDAVGKFLECE